MAVLTPNSTPHRSRLGTVGKRIGKRIGRRVFRRIGAGIVAVFTEMSRARAMAAEIEAVMDLTDAQLAARGQTRPGALRLVARAYL